MFQKIKTIFVCSKCDSQFPKWLGQCPECGAWGTVVEQSAGKIKDERSKIPAGQVVDFSKIQGREFSRIKTMIGEMDRVLGGGIVQGSLILLGGEPGIGKSTLVLQLANHLINQTVLYISGEESAEQIKMRMDRLEIKADKLQFLGETDIEVICATIAKEKPALAIVDSIQTIWFSDLPSEAGSVNQVRACTAKLLETAKKCYIPIFIVGHVTKEGTVAGPKTLEHLVDTVLYLEGDPYHQFRLLRAVKNRFGATNEVGVFDMTKNGLVEIKNPSAVFLGARQNILPGATVGTIIEGSRAFLIEVQALINRTNFGYPQRRAIGFDHNRLQLLIAVLARRCGINLNNFDVHLNIAGGISSREPAIDLPICWAIISAFKNKKLDSLTASFGEVGLGAEIRPVSEPEKRIKEAEKMGFKRVIIPKSTKISYKYKLQIVEINNLNELLKL